jgi:hypothetical protein
MRLNNYLLYGACLLVIGASYYLQKTKEMVSQTFVDRTENNEKVAHIIRQDDCFHPFGNVKFRAPTHYTLQIYDEKGRIKSSLETLFYSKAKRLAKTSLTEE